MYMYIYIDMHIHVYIYIYTVDMYMYIYIHIHGKVPKTTFATQLITSEELHILQTRVKEAVSYWLYNTMVF